MPLKNHDESETRQRAIASAIATAAREGDQQGFEDGLGDLFGAIHEEILQSAAAYSQSADSRILAARGVRQLTSDETAYYSSLIKAMRSGVSMSLTDVDKTLPQTIIEQVMEDMEVDHPLLQAVDTVSVKALTKYVYNADAGESAAWGDLGSEITQEINSGFGALDLLQAKLSAWLAVDMDMLELGPTWIDAYVRKCLAEAIAIGMERAIVTGTGKSMPIGMDRSVADDVTVTSGEYPKKTAIAVTDLGRKTYGDLVARLAKTRGGKDRAVSGLIMVCNPQDYYKLVMPATTVMTPDGRYINDVLPMPTKIIPSSACTAGEAVLGMGKRYILAVGGKRGIAFSDDYKFLEDKRYYKIVSYANGRPKDDSSFLRLDISALEPLYLEVRAVADSVDLGA